MTGVQTCALPIYLDWCRSHGTDPSDDSAEFFIEQTEIDAMERQLIDDEEYGLWL